MSSAAGCGRSSCCWMWCADSGCHQHLAVNNGVRNQTADSDVLRSVGVPNLKTATVPVAFWDKSRRAKPCSKTACSKSPSNHAGLPHSRQPPADHGRLDGDPRFHDCAIGRRYSGRQTAADRCRCDLRKALPPTVPAAVPHCHRIVPAAFPALPSDRSPPLKYARPCLSSRKQGPRPIESNHNAGNEVSVCLSGIVAGLLSTLP